MIRSFAYESGFFGNGVSGACWDTSQRLWVATDGPIYRGLVSGPSAHFERVAPPDGEEDESFKRCAEDGNGGLLVTRDRGLLRVKEWKWKRVTKTERVRS